MEPGFHTELRRLALPAWGTLVLKPLADLAEHSLVSWRLGTHGLAAMGTAAAVLDPLLGLATAPLCWHATSSVARHRGALAAATAIATEALLVAVCLGLLAGITLHLGSRFMLDWMQLGDFMVLALPYLRTRAFGVPFAFASAALQGSFRGLADTRTPLVVTVLQQAARLALAALFAWAGQLAGGLQSLALVSVVSDAAAAVSLFGVFAWRFGFVKKGASLQTISGFVLAGGALYVRKVALEFARTGQSMAAAALGPECAAAHTLLRQVSGMAALNVDCLEVAAQAMVGARQGRAAGAIARRLVLYGTAMGIALGAGMVIWREQIFSLLSGDAGVRALGIGTVPLVGALQIFAAPAFVLDGVFVGGQQYWPLAAVTAIAALASRAWLRHGAGELWAVWAAFGIVVAIRSLLLASCLALSPTWSTEVLKQRAAE